MSAAEAISGSSRRTDRRSLPHLLAARDAVLQRQAGVAARPRRVGSDAARLVPYLHDCFHNFRDGETSANSQELEVRKGAVKDPGDWTWQQDSSTTVEATCGVS